MNPTLRWIIDIQDGAMGERVRVVPPRPRLWRALRIALNHGRQAFAAGWRGDENIVLLSGTRADIAKAALVLVREADRDA